ncbi:hypothetical protein KAFR_0D01410 [Kazachstania africana CBS 2517]|uniref:Pheromone-processing carboxypeptidase KEX1 n=1 Tax=Kazachstania africana (strain ATCC 22294 / BCRC 22015 / CBS 2517 / CECT 1963 / NBRC 1671 / NRRL Y-8276) TaxID=1071382 RepID=H2ATT7_KAZAF|nr:hypothetical protein KAFR_0D01410 [Kazachstania africana CBS 2517]CCF57787.1 hypothetical protein KAFR_0D01410 [Kazachstania africana CBS 2517]
MRTVLLLLAQCVVALSFILKDSNDYLVKNPMDIPGLHKFDSMDMIPTMYAGHLPYLSQEQLNTDLNLPSDFGFFFWKFNKLNVTNSKDNTLIFWLNGGPGCSSMDGALMEIGPFRININGEAISNPGTWNTRSDLVFVDQPVGTGFSNVVNFNQFNDLTYLENLNQVTDHFLGFLDNYFTIFPGDLSKNIIIAGESYSGQFIPYIAKSILKRNQRKNGTYINLVKLLIGNGWIDPQTQSLSFLPFAMENGIIDEHDSNFKPILKSHENCQNKINSIDDPSKDEQFEYPECDAIIHDILKITRDKTVNTDKQCINIYDYELRDSFPSCGMNWPEDIPNLGKFLNNPVLQKTLNIDVEWLPKWVECQNNVNIKLTNKGFDPSINLFPDILSQGLEIILFNGDKDLICNNKGVLDSINKLSWGNKTGFTDEMESYDWVYRREDNEEYDEPAGYINYERNLTFISVFNASHMVPYDKGEISRGILDIAMNNVLLHSMGKRLALITSDHPYVDDEDAPTGSDIDNSDYYEYYDDYDYYNYYDNENSGEEPDNEHEEDVESNGYFSAVITLSMMCLLVTVYAVVKFRHKLASLFKKDSYIRINSQKTVSWADDLEIGADLEMNDLNISDDAVPMRNSDESFEIDDI